MPRIIFILIALALLAGGMVLLSNGAREVPTGTIEHDVSPNTNG